MQDQGQKNIGEWIVPSLGGVNKVIRLIHGDLCAGVPQYDVVVCSAFKNDYLKTPFSLIGSLWKQIRIDVEELSSDPELDLRNMGCWLSRETGTRFHRIACMELLDAFTFFTRREDAINTIIRKTSSTLRFMLEQADMSGIPIRTIALPILGTGEQKLDLAFILSPLITAADYLLRNTSAESITIYERDQEKANLVLQILNNTFSVKKTDPRVFISYSSKQSDSAQNIALLLAQNGVSVWIAPDSIPEGSSYQLAIPIALNKVDVVLLILTPDAENSRWVQKEIGSAIGSGKKILPYQLYQYTLGQAFRFVLDGEQILMHNTRSIIPYEQLLIRVKDALNEA